MALLLTIYLAVLGLGIVYVLLILFNQIGYVYATAKGPVVDPELHETILLVVSAQNAFLPTDTMGQDNARNRDVIHRINSTIDIFRKAGKEIVFCTHVKKRKSFRSLFMPHIPVLGTMEAQVNDDIPLLGAVSIRQFRCDAFANPKLQRYLNRQGTRRLFVVGYSAEEAIYYTVQSAIDRGYEVVVVEDAVVAAFGEKSKSKQLAAYEVMGAKLIDTRQCEKLPLQKIIDQQVS